MAEFVWPWPKGTRASQEFGSNPGGVNPSGGHTGLDAALPVGTPLRAPADGVVTLEGWMQTDNGSDNQYWLTNGGGICYAMDFGEGRPAMTVGHLSATFVSRGDRVKQGQIFAESGNTGKWTTGPHAHLEFLPPVYNLNSPTYGRVNPRNYCTGYWEDQVVLAPQGNVVTLLQPYQRETQTKVWERIAPDNSTDLTKVKLWDEETIFDFGGYVLGTDALGDGNRVWFRGRYSEVYFHSSAFKDMDTHDLPNLTPVSTTPPPVVVVPAPTPTPAPVPAPEPAVLSLHGADVSNHQGDIELAGLPGDFIGIKASEGNGYVDPKLERNAAKSENRTRIFYHFARPDLGNTPGAELDWFLKCVEPYLRTGDILALDWEAEKADLSDVGWVNTFLTGAQGARGGTPLLYAGNKAINAAGEKWAPVENRFPLWYPAYPLGATTIEGFNPGAAGARPPVVWGGKAMLIWQYTSAGRLPGYSGNLDLNVLYGTKDDLAALGVTRLTAPAPVPVPEPEPLPNTGKTLPTIDQPIRDLVEYYKER